MFSEILEKIKAYDKIIIHRHEKPDGDAIGSQTGLAFLIRDNFPEKTVYIVGDTSERFSFMEGSAPDVIADSEYVDALAIILDTSAASLISDKRYLLAKERVRIDHHIFVEKIAECELTDTSYESCAGLVADLAINTSLRFTERSAKALYTGMVTDSGRFRYDSTTSDTFRIASKLRELPFKTEEIYSHLYIDSLDSLKLRASFILKIQKHPTAPLAHIYTTKEELRELKVDTFTVSRGMVGTMSDISGIDVWVNFTETENGVLAELRSSKYNVNPIAVKHGGGGHAKASGATLRDKAEAEAMLFELSELTKNQ